MTVSASASPLSGADPVSGDGSLGALDFHVEIVVRLPGEWSEVRRAEILGAELRRARELLACGVIQRIWRVPGGLHNVGIWRVATPAELHEAIVSLPCFPWIDAKVMALAPHPAELISRDPS